MSSYYRGAHGIIFVYDVTRPESFHGLKAWMTEIETYLPNGGADVVRTLICETHDGCNGRNKSSFERMRPPTPYLSCLLHTRFCVSEPPVSEPRR